MYESPRTYTWTIAPTYVNTLAGVGGSSGFVDGRLLDSKFNDPRGSVQVGSDIYVCDRVNNILRKIDLTNSLVTTIDPGKYAIQFNGLNNYLSIPHSANLDSNSVTVELWFTLKGDLNTNANNNWRSLIRKGSTSGTTTGWDVVLEQSRVVTWDIGVGGVTSRLFVDVGMQLNEPIHLAFVYDAVIGKQSVYANGVLKGSQDITPGVIGPNSEPIIVAGGTNTGNFPNGSGYTPGKYCNIRVWNVARSAADILAYYRGGLPARPNDLVGSFKCSEGSGSIANDDSGRSSAGTLVNNPTWTTTDVAVPLLSEPRDITAYDTLDGNGPMLYVADFYNSVIRKVDPRTLETTVFAGRLGTPGTVNDVGELARFYHPVGIVAHDGYLYVSDWSHHTIRRIHINSRSVSAFAGTTSAGSADGQGTNARFQNPAGLAIDTTGTNYLYVADYSNHTIRRIDLQGANVTTFAGAAGVAGSNSGAAPSLARFNLPYGLSFDRNCSRLFIAEYGNHDIRMINLPANLAMTIAGKSGERGYGDNTGGAARFNYPSHLSPTGTGFNEGAFVGDYYNHAVRAVTFLPLAVFKNAPPRLTNQQTIAVSVVGAGLTAYEYQLDSEDPLLVTTGVGITKSGLAEGPHTLKVRGCGVNNEWQLAEEATNLTWTIDVTPPIAKLSNLPTNPTYDLLADISVAGESEAVVRYKYKLDSGAWTASISHVLPIKLRDLAPGTHTLLVVGQDEAGNWQADADATSYQWLVKPVYITTVAGQAALGLVDGKWYEAKFADPWGLTKLGDMLYIADMGNKCIRSMDLLTGEVKTVAGSPLGFSVLSFDGSDDFVQAPAATYFTGDFTVMAWVYVRNYNNWSRVIDFGNGPNSDNILLALSNSTTGRPNLHIFNGESSSNMTAPNPIPLNQWVHLAATLQGSIAKIYVDGVEVISGALNTPRSVNRTRCYIGRSNWGESLANAFMADLSIWSFAKTVDDIQANKNARLIGNESGLVAYWPMSDQDSKLIDLGPGRLDATLFGNPTWMANAGPPIISGDGVGVAARFKTPRGITVGSDGKLYVADSTEHTIRKIDPATRLVTTYAGTRDVPGTVNGIGLAAKFNTPLGLEPYSNYIFVVSNEDRIRRIDLNNAEVTTFAGGGAGAVDGVGIAAKFNNPRGIAQADGVLYVSDYSNHTIRKVAIDTAQVTTLAGTAGVAGSVDGIGAEARFNTPNGIGVDDEGNVFVTEYNGRIIRKLSPVGSDNWKVTTVAGLYNTSGFVDGLGMASRFRYLSFMAKDGPYGFFFADRDNNCIRKLSLQPWVNLANTPSPITNLRTVNIAVRGGGVTAYKFKFDDEVDWRPELPAGTDLFLENLDEKTHTVQVIGKGAINDWQPDAAPTRFVWTIDLTAPTAELVNKPASSTLDDMTSILVGGDDVIIYNLNLADEIFYHERSTLD